MRKHEFGIRATSGSRNQAKNQYDIEVSAAPKKGLPLYELRVMAARINTVFEIYIYLAKIEP